MKHNLKITIIILSMFLISQVIGLYVVNSYSNTKVLPYGMQANVPASSGSGLISIIFSLIFAILIIFLLTRYKSKIVMKVWFFLVTVLALGVTFVSFFPPIKAVSLWVLILAVPLAFFKIYKRDILIHNITEVLIYPGIAAIFVPLLNIIGIIILLVIISIYDMWAVWKSKIMIKMANYQMKELKILGGFMIPYLSKAQKKKVKKMSKEELKKKGIKAKVGILGGGDVVFPMISAGVVLVYWGLIPAIITTLGALLGLSLLLFFSEKKKAYPAMPFISAGVFLAFLINWLFVI